MGESQSKQKSLHCPSTFRVTEHATMMNTYSPTLEDFPGRWKRVRCKSMEGKHGAFDRKVVPGRGDHMDKGRVAYQSRLRGRSVFWFPASTSKSFFILQLIFLGNKLVKGGEIVTKEAWRIKARPDNLLKHFLDIHQRCNSRNFLDIQIQTVHCSIYCSQLLDGNNNAYLPELLWKPNEPTEVLLRRKCWEICFSTKAYLPVI